MRYTALSVTMIRRLSAALAPLATMTSPAIAQDLDPMFDDIIVTAQKRDQLLEDVPASITVFSRDDLRTANVTGVRDWVALSPNVSVSASGNARDATLNIRGVQNVGGIVASNAVYLDEFGLTAGGDSSLVSLGMLDLERVEVLRGPQGVFYGRNSIGGAVQLTSAKPVNELQIEALLGLSSFRTRTIQVIGNVPITETFYIRGAVSHETSRGWIRNVNPAVAGTGLPGDTNGYTDTNFKIAARWVWNQDTTIDVRFLGNDQSKGLDDLLPSFEYEPEGISTFLELCADGQPLVSLGFCSQSNRVEQSPQLFSPSLSREKRTVEFNNPWSSGRRAEILTARLAHDLGLAEVVAQGGIITTRFNLRGDEDMSPLRGFPFEQRNLLKSRSVEVRLQNSDTGPLNWVVGANYSKDNTSQFFRYVDEGTGEGGYFFPGEGDSYAETETVNLQTYALFGNIDYKPTKRLTLSAGARLTQDTISESYSNQYMCCTPVNLGGAFGIIGDVADERDSSAGVSKYKDFSPRISAAYELNSGNVYATVSKGYKAGGFVFNLDAPVSSYEPEIAWSFEAGYKGILFTDRVRFNASLFWLDWRDLQIPSSVRVPGTASFVEQIANAGKTTIRGFEADVVARPIDSFTIGGNVGFIDGIYEEFLTSNPIEEGVIDYSGERIVGAARWTGSAFAQFVRSFSDSVSGSLRAEVSYSGERPAFDCIGSGNDACNVPKNQKWNFRVGVEAKRWSLTAYVENAFNANYSTTTNNYFSYVGIWRDYQPRRLGLQLRVKSL